MKVAHVGNYSPDKPDGVKRSVSRLALHLHQLGVDVELLHLDSDVNEVAERQVDGIRVWDLPGPRTSAVAILTLPRRTREFLAARCSDWDLVHLHSAFTPVNVSVARSTRAYVVSPHNGLHPRVLGGRRSALKRGWLAAVEGRYLARARCVLVSNDNEETQVRNVVPGARTRKVAMGVDSDLIVREVQPPSRGEWWLYVGRLDMEAKGLDLLLKGYAGAAAVADVPNLKIAGPDFRGNEAVLRRMAADLGLADRIEFVGPVFSDGKYELIAGARAVLQPSRWEGMSLALLEVMALARPVLVTPATNMGALVREADAGEVVDESVSGVASGLVQLATATSEKLDHMGANGRKAMTDSYTWEVASERVATIYEEALVTP